MVPVEVGRATSADSLLRANEQLVLSALRAQTEAETITKVLHDVSRSAELDALTDLPNRVLLLDRFARAIALAKRHHTLIALLFLDLDRFKHINDTLGHAAGDDVLKVVARRLLASVRDADTVCRLGGDEFLILVTDVSLASDASLIAKKVIASLGAPCRVAGQAISLCASIGISLYPDDGEDAATLIDRADVAMYAAKNRVHERFVFFRDAALKSDLARIAAKEAGRSPLVAGPPVPPETESHGSTPAPVVCGTPGVPTRPGDHLLRVDAERLRQGRTEFIDVVAHELSNPLTPIRASAGILGLTRVESSQSRDPLAVIGLEDVEMADVVDDAAKTVRAQIAQQRQTLHVHLPAYPMIVLGDRVQLVQILCCLLENASSFTQPDGEITISAELVGDAVVLEVADNGIGIDAQSLSDVFKPFVGGSHGRLKPGGGLV